MKFTISTTRLAALFLSTLFFTTISRADFSQLSHRYLSPIDFALKIQRTLPLNLLFAEELQSQNINYTAGLQSGDCLIQSQEYANGSNYAQTLNALGGDNPSTGHPTSESPTAAFLNQVSKCIDDGLNAELNPGQFSGPKIVGPQAELVPSSFFKRYDLAFDTAVVARYFPNLKFKLPGPLSCKFMANGHEICIPHQVHGVSHYCTAKRCDPLTVLNQKLTWQDLTPESRRQFILNLVNIVYGDVSVLVDDGYFKNKNEVVNQVIEDAVATNENDSLTEIAVIVVKFLMMRDEFLSY